MIRTITDDDFKFLRPLLEDWQVAAYVDYGIVYNSAREAVYVRRNEPQDHVKDLPKDQQDEIARLVALDLPPAGISSGLG